MNESQISPILWKISDEFCPRIIVTDGIIQCVSAVVNPPFSVTRLWIHFRIDFIASACISESQKFKFLVFENVSMLERIESGLFSETSLKSVVISRSVEVLCENCFLKCKLLSSVTIESESKLSRSEKYAFSRTGLLKIVIPSSVEVLGENCFSKCGSLSDVRFESDSILSRIEKEAFYETVLIEIVIPSSVEIWVRIAFFDVYHSSH
jgi:hypothetical protein